MLFQPLLMCSRCLLSYLVFFCLFSHLGLTVFLLEVYISGVMFFDVAKQIEQLVIETRLLLSPFFFVLLFDESLDASIWCFVGVIIVYVSELLKSLEVLPPIVKRIHLFSR